MRTVYGMVTALICLLAAFPAVARPTSTDSTREVARQCDAVADGDDAIQACEDLIRSRRYKGRQLSMIYNNLGVAYFRMGDHEHAIEAFSNALQADVRNVVPRTNRARSLTAVAKFDDAIVDMNAVIKLTATADNFALRADIRARNNDLDGAIADYSEAIKRQPAVTMYYESRAQIYAKLSRHAEAIEDYSRAIQLNPRDPSLFFGRGLAWSNAGKCDQAVPDYTKAIELSPRFSNAYNNRGVCYLRSGKRDEAIADYEAALKWEPGNTKAMDNLAVVKNMPTAQPIPPNIVVPKFEVPPVQELLKVPEYPIEVAPPPTVIEKE